MAVVIGGRRALQVCLGMARLQFSWLVLGWKAHYFLVFLFYASFMECAFYGEIRGSRVCCSGHLFCACQWLDRHHDGMGVPQPGYAVLWNCVRNGAALAQSLGTHILSSLHCTVGAPVIAVQIPLVLFGV
jgi:hypothetical protein